MTEQFVDSGGAKLWTISAGNGVPIVLCNGGPGCCDYLAPRLYRLRILNGCNARIVNLHIGGARMWQI